MCDLEKTCDQCAYYPRAKKKGNSECPPGNLIYRIIDLYNGINHPVPQPHNIQVSDSASDKRSRQM